MSRPREYEDKARIQVYLERELLAEVDAAAGPGGRSAFVVDALWRYLDAVAAATTGWADTNRRRGELIEVESRRELSPAEGAELEDLQRLADLRTDLLDPSPSSRPALVPPDRARTLLRQEMESLSEDCWCAAWMSGLEFQLWAIAKAGGGRSGQGEVSPRRAAWLLGLAARAGGWWTFESFVDMAEWEGRAADYAQALPWVGGGPAPADVGERPILGYFEEDDWRELALSLDGDPRWTFADGDELRTAPTRWRPMPSAPSEAVDEGGKP